MKLTMWAAASGIAALVVGSALGFWAGRSRSLGSAVVFISVGQGDCTLVTSDGHSALIDVGPRTNSTDAGTQFIVPDLNKWGIRHLDWILLSHPDRDHVGGLIGVHRAFPEAKIIMSAVFKTDPKMLNELTHDGVKARSVDWVTSMDGNLGVFKVVLRCPPWDPSSDDNLGSMFVHLADGGASLTTSGDAPMAAEEAMIPVFDWRAQILHLGHHGSRHSTSVAWLKAVQPQIAIASCGLHNEYGFPKQVVIDKLKAAGIELRRTDLDGDLYYQDVNHRFVREPTP